MHKRNVLESPRLSELKKKKKKIFIRKIIIFGIILVLLVVGMSFLSRVKKLNIYEISVEGNKIIDTDTVRKVTEEKLSDYYIWLFPKTNLFLYPKNGLKTTLADTFKRFENIDLSLENTNTLKIKVTERSPEFMWCGNTPHVAGERESCYFLDTYGYMFDEAPYFSGEVYFKFYETIHTPEDNSNPSGSYIAKGYFDKLILFKNTLTEMDLKPVMIHIGDDNNIKIGLSRTKASGNPPEIIFKKDADIQKISANLKAALNAEPLLSKFKKEYASLEYIDLRFGNKVYYKFK